MKSYIKIILSLILSLFFATFKPLMKLVFDIDVFENNFILKQSHILFIISVTWFLIELVRTSKKIIIKKMDLAQENNLDSRKLFTLINILEKVIVFIIIILAIGMILISFENIKKFGLGIFASAGLAGIVIAFSAQKIFGTLFAGIQIAITQPFRIDDFVNVEGEVGTIEEINLTYIVVRIWDKRRLILPATYFLEKPFQNWTRTNAELIGSVFLYTDYYIDFNALRDELTKCLEDSPLWDRKLNVLQITNAQPTSIEMRILVSAKNASLLWDLRVFIREKMIEYIRCHFPDSLPKSRIVLEKESK